MKYGPKRRLRLQAAGGAQAFGLAAVERLNAGTIIGLPIGIAAYFWANRLIPAAMEGRAAWEAHALFIAWALALLWAALRPVARGWAELASCAAAACLLLPVVNALTTERHLGVTLPGVAGRGDWRLAGFDLTMLAFGLLFAWAAWRLMRKARGARAGAGAVSFPVPAVGKTEPAE